MTHPEPGEQSEFVPVCPGEFGAEVRLQLMSQIPKVKLGISSKSHRNTLEWCVEPFDCFSPN